MRYQLILLLIIGLLLGCKKSDRLAWNLVSAPKVEQLSVKSNSITSFELSAHFTSSGHDPKAQYGFCFSTNNQNPTINDDVIYLSEGMEGIGTTTIPWNTTAPLFCRAFIKNKVATVYSEFLLVIWPGNAQNKPVVIVNDPLDVRFFDATIIGQVLYDGGLPILNQGFQLCNQSTFTGASLVNINLNSGLSSFNHTFLNLNENTGYFVRAFATNMVGTTYSTLSFFVTDNFYQIGEVGPAGGIIFYHKTDTLDGWNFLECAPLDIGTSKVFATSNQLTMIPNLEYGLGQGDENTALILSAIGNGNNAAKACQTYTINGFSDWYLPTRDELIKLYQNLLPLNQGGLSGNTYWSSNQDPVYAQNAWVQSMQQVPSGTGTYTQQKTTLNRVRPVRCF
jgi:hypothetical protein